MLNLLLHPTCLQLLARSMRLRSALRRRRQSAQRAEAQRAAFYETVWREAAERLGGEMTALGDGIFEIRIGELRTRVCRNYTILDDPVTLLLAGDKLAVYRQLSLHEVPITEHREFDFQSLDIARQFLRSAGGPCVVKPAQDTGAGAGVTTGITRPADLVRASIAAGAWGRRLLIERQVAGDNYRLLYLDGVLLDAVVRHAPAIVGDGRSTIRELIRRENAERLAGGFAAAQVLVNDDLDLRRTLARQRLTLGSVPAAGSRIPLKTVINDNAGRENESAADRLCDSIIETGARAAEAVGVRLAGVDIVTTDASRPLTDSGGVVLEVNTTPGFYYHYHKRDGRCPVADLVLESLCGSMAVATSR